MVAMRKLSIVMLSALLMSSLILPALSQEEKILSHDVSLLMPIADALSGSVWLRLQGLDPIHAADQYREFSLQSPGAGPVLIPFREPSPKFSRNIIVSYNVGRYPYQTEPCVAVDPTNPDHLLMALDDYNFNGDAIYVSLDGGAAWEGPIAMKVLMRDEWGGNPALAFSRSGDAYFAQMSIGYRWVTVANLALVAEVASIAVYKSTREERGFTWSDPIAAAVGLPHSIPLQKTLNVTFLDRPWIAVGPDPGDPDRDNIYVTYTEFVETYPILEEYPYLGAPLVSITIKLIRSTDGGATFSDPVAVSPTYTYLVGEEYRRIVQGSQSFVAPDGKLYVAFYDALDDGPWKGLFAPTITWSTDGGLSFSKPVAIDYVSEIDYFVPPTFFRAWPSMSPRIAVDQEGSVYTVFVANPIGPDDSDVYFSASYDGGRTWSKHKRINDDLTTRDQFFPSIGVSRNGTIHLSFGDKRDDPADVRYHMYYTKSSDGGETWMQNARITDYPSNPNYGIPAFLGDFFSMAVSEGDVHIAWTDTRLGRAGSPASNAATTRMEHVPSPTIYLSPPSGPAGTSVTIMGFNFAPHLREVYIELEGVIISSLLTDDDGRFTATLFMPISGEGTHTVRAMDILGNVAEASFYTEFGFNDIRDEFEENFEDIRSQLTTIKEGLGDIDATDIRPEVDRLEASVESLIGRLDDFELKVNAQVSEDTDLMWIAVALAVLAISISVATFATQLLRVRGRSEGPRRSAVTRSVSNRYG